MKIVFSTSRTYPHMNPRKVDFIARKVRARSGVFSDGRSGLRERWGRKSIVIVLRFVQEVVRKGRLWITRVM